MNNPDPVPTNLTVAWSDSTTAQLSWDAVSGAASYDWLLSEDGVNFTVQQTGVAGTSATVTLEQDTFYWFKVRVSGSASASEAVKSISFSPTDDFAASVDGSGVVTFTFTAHPNASNYVLELVGSPDFISNEVQSGFTYQLPQDGSGSAYEFRLAPIAGFTSFSKAEEAIVFVAYP